MITRRISRTIISVGLIFLLIGCESLTSLQTAEVLDEGDSSAGIGSRITANGDEQEVGGLGQLSAAEVYYRYGVAERLDVGGKMNILGIALDAKYQLAGFQEETGAAFSVGAGLGYQVHNDNPYFEAGLPTYLSITAPRWFTFYANPQVWYRNYSQRVQIASDPDQFHNPRSSFLYGGAAGVRFGRQRFALLLEMGYFRETDEILARDLRDSPNAFHVAFGIRFGAGWF